MSTRTGRAGLERLWSSAEVLPTPNEIDAPGLWLARIDLPLTDDAPPTAGLDDDEPDAPEGNA